MYNEALDKAVAEGGNVLVPGGVLEGGRPMNQVAT